MIAGPGGQENFIGPTFRSHRPKGETEDDIPNLDRGIRTVIFQRVNTQTNSFELCVWPGCDHGTRGPCSGTAEGHSPPQPPTQAVLDPALLPLFHGRGLVGRPQHGDTATPGEQGLLTPTLHHPIRLTPNHTPHDTGYQGPPEAAWPYRPRLSVAWPADPHLVQALHSSDG